MVTKKAERMRAEQVSAAIDQLLREPEAQVGSAEDAAVLDTARQLARLPALLGPPDPALEQLVMRQVRVGDLEQRRRPARRLGWAAAGLALVLLLVLVLTPLGQTAVASFMAVFDLGRTEVRVTPAITGSVPAATPGAQGEAVRQALTLDEARALVSFDIPQPAYLPPGYDLLQVAGVSYPDLPAWVPQPFQVELDYGDGQGHQITLRLYPIVLGDRASIAGLDLKASPIRDVQDVEVNGQPGVLLQLGERRAETGWQEVVWEHGDLIVALSATHLTESELLRTARSIR